MMEGMGLTERDKEKTPCISLLSEYERERVRNVEYVWVQWRARDA